ncbi:DUF4124 domain-containing protein [Marinobacter halotolerans]|uniref:DUF4124 domain-containing protein n=1 Tax=Marinobacter halotolerans TaxID=1569211 RepID=UPI00124908B5|nr:DUF4124 domain-containing protein [Marinobacter halotolerans]
MMPGRHFVLLCLPLLAQPVTAEMYTWTDDQGITHFSDTAPSRHETKAVTLKAPSVIPMAGNIRQSEKVRGIYRQIRQNRERDKSTRDSVPDKSKLKAQKQCDKLERRLDKIQSQLRAGYANDRGNSLRRQRRELSQQHSWQCVLG